MDRYIDGSVSVEYLQFDSILGTISGTTTTNDTRLVAIDAG